MWLLFLSTPINTGNNCANAKYDWASVFTKQILPRLAAPCGSRRYIHTASHEVQHKYVYYMLLELFMWYLVNILYVTPVVSVKSDSWILEEHCLSPRSISTSTYEITLYTPPHHLTIKTWPKSVLARSAQADAATPSDLWGHSTFKILANCSELETNKSVNSWQFKFL
jgi:hypothetical protein